MNIDNYFIKQETIAIICNYMYKYFNTVKQVATCTIDKDIVLDT